MGYVGDDLPSLFDRGPATKALRSMAALGGDTLLRYVKANTPVDKGRLRQSWYRTTVKPHRSIAGSGYETSVETQTPYAAEVEHGTGLWGPEHKKYLIKPKKPGGSLSWVQGGRRVFAKSVWHPGSPGAHMMALGAVKTEATLEPALEPALVRWKIDTEHLFGVAKARRH